MSPDSHQCGLRTATRSLHTLIAGVALFIVAPAFLRAQTFVQLTDLDPQNQLGPRLTSVVVRNKLSAAGRLFAVLGSKISLFNATVSPALVYEFASDPGWNRVLFGQQDVYIRSFNNVSTSTTRLQGPSGLDVSSARNVYIADPFNSRVVLATFNPSSQTLSEFAVTPGDPSLRDVIDVAWDGQTLVFQTNSFYALNPSGVVSYWNWLMGIPPSLVWTYGSEGNGPGQFLGPRGICVGHDLGSDGGSVFSNEFYIADAGNKRLAWLERNSSGAVWRGSITLPDGGVPVDCTVDAFGNVYAADSANSRLVKYTWNLNYIDRYGVYGVGASNNNTFAHPHAIHAPFGTKKNGSNQTIWYGEGRILTAEDWGAQSGAREHYLGVNVTNAGVSVDSGGPFAAFGYVTTDHAYQTVSVVDWNGSQVRLIQFGVLTPPSQAWFGWDGTQDNGSPAPAGSYSFKSHIVSGYGCTGQAWCDKTVLLSFNWPGCAMNHGICYEGPTGAPPAIADADPTTLFLQQRVLPAERPLSRVTVLDATAPVSEVAANGGSLADAVRRYGVRGLRFSVTRAAVNSPVTIRIYAVSGRLMRVLVNEQLDPGTYEVGWDGS